MAHGRGRYSNPFGGVNNYQQVLDVAPNLVNSPESVQALAAYGATDAEAQAVAGVYEANRLRLQLENMPEEIRPSAYNALSERERELLTLAKYEAPQQPDEKQGFFGRTFGNIPYLSDAVENTLSGVGKVVAAPLKPALDLFNWAEETKDQAFRAAYRLDSPLLGIVPRVRAGRQDDTTVVLDEQGAPGGDAGDWWSIGSWARAWREVDDGDRVFDARDYEEITGRYDETTVLAAYNLSKGESPEEVLRLLMGRGVDLPRATEAVFGEQTAQALADFDKAKISIGRVAGDVFGDPRVEFKAIRFNLTSGVVDGLDAIFADPTLVGGKVSRGIKAARWGVRGADVGRLDSLMQTDQAVRGWNRVGAQLETLRTAESAEDKARAFDRLANEGLVPRELIDPMLRGGVRDAETARTYLVQARRGIDIVTGTRARQLLPGRLTARGERLLEAKGALREKIDWALDGPKLLDLATDSATYDSATAAAARREQLTERLGKKGPLDPTARLARIGLGVRRLTTKLPEQEKLRLTHPESAFEVHRAAMMTGMPKYWADEIAAQYLAATHGGRRRIEKGMLETMLELAANGSPSVRAWASGFVDDANDLAANRAYSPGGVDVKMLDGTARHLAVTAKQLTEVIALPSMTEITKVAARVGMLDRIGSFTHAEAFEWYMRTVFPPATLLRPALALRNIGEEDLGHAVVYGVKDLLQARAALSVAKSEEGKILQTFTSIMDDADVEQVLAEPTVENVVRGTLRSNLKRLTVSPAAKAKNKALRAIAGPDMAQYVDELASNPGMKNSIARSGLLNAQRGGMGYFSRESEEFMRVKRGGKYHTVHIKESGSYAQRSTEGRDGAMRLYRQLVDMPDDEIVRPALDLWDDPDRLDKLTDILLSPEYARYRAMSERMVPERVPAGLSEEALNRAMARDWAETVFRHVEAHVTAPDGTVVDEILTPLREGRVPDPDTLENLAKKPGHVVARDTMLVANPDNILTSLVQKGFQGIGEAIDWASRQPILMAHYAEARRAQRGVEKEIIKHLGPAEGNRLLQGRAIEVAITETLRNVDNPALRSQASVWFRNLIPFWRAQEEFYTRWARRSVHSMGAIRKAQLLMHGMRHIGFVHTDQEGRDYFVYPTLGPGQQLIGTLFGAPDTAVGYPFRSQVQFLNQGLDPRGIAPSFGPLGTIPMNLLVERVPEAGSVVEAIIGEQAFGRSWLEQLTPTVLRRAFDLQDSSEQMASAKLQFVQVAAAEDPDGSKGLYLKPDANEEDQQAFFERAERWARHIVALRFVYGLSAPSAPQQGDLSGDAKVQVKGLRTVSDEFRVLVASGLPFEEAVAQFMARHPNGAPWTVGKSSPTVTGSLPSTEVAGEWLTENRDFAQTYKRLVPFLVPVEPGDYDKNAYRLQMAYKLREKKDVAEFYGDVALSGVLGRYYDDRERYEAALEQGLAQGSTAYVDELRRVWKQHRDTLVATNPLLRRYFAERELRADDRLAAIVQWKNASAAGDLPAGPGTEAISAMVSARDAYERALVTVYGRRDSEAKMYRDAVEGRYLGFQRQMAAKHPNAKAFYDRIIAPLDEE